MADPRDRVALDRFPPHLWVTAVLVLLTVVYAVLQIGWVRPYLPADPTPNLARPPASAAAPAGLSAWRDRYHAGPGTTPVWKLEPARWARAHLGMTIQVFVFTLAALVLLVLRSTDPTALLSVLALALSGVAGGGPLLGVEHVLPLGLWRVLTVFAWMAGPLAFPIIALAIVYFPSPSPLLQRRPWLRAVPFLVAAPMLVLAAGTSLYLVGVDGMRDLAAWDAANPWAYYGSFAAALAINVAAVVEGVYRYRIYHDANERRRIQMAVYSAVPGVFAYALKDGVPIAAMLTGARVPMYPWMVTAFLQALVLLPAFGLTYAVGVARVLGPRMVLRRSLQYALASRTLTVIPMAAGVLLGTALWRQSLQQLLTSGSIVYLVLFGLTLAALQYRERARQWLDRAVLPLRVRRPQDPRLARLARALRDRSDGPGDARHRADRTGAAPGSHGDARRRHRRGTPLAGDRRQPGRHAARPRRRPRDDAAVVGGAAGNLLDDPRSPARRLPPAEIAWLEETRTALIVPIVGQDRALVAALVLGAKRSEEAYSAEDRELLASIAAQAGLGLDIARLRSQRPIDTDAATKKLTVEILPPMMECPRCGRCEEAALVTCPSDGAELKPGPTPRVIDNKYRIEQLLGRGGMGAVYRARDMRLDRLVALKVVRPELLEETDARRRFKREAQIVARLQHPGIVSIFDFGTLTGGGAYLVMELVRGEDLRRVLHREGRLDTARAARILSAVCAAIEAAHQEGVLHRNLKPENILLPGGDVEAKVLDFGVAKLVGNESGETVQTEAQATLTMAGTIIGTPAYMAPEQLRAGAPDPRTDVFALGVIAYEMLSGDLPFSRGSLTDVILAQARGAQALRERNAGVPADLERAIGRALQLNPDERPASPQTFAAEVARAVAAT